MGRQLAALLLWLSCCRAENGASLRGRDANLSRGLLELKGTSDRTSCGTDRSKLPSDCDREDYGSCGNACCMVEVTFSKRSPAVLSSAIDQFLKTGGTDGLFKEDSGKTEPSVSGGVQDIRIAKGSSIQWQYVKKGQHATYKGGYIDALHFGIYGPPPGKRKEGDQAHLRISSSSQASGALFDYGQNYKTIRDMVTELFGENREVKVLWGCGSPKSSLPAAWEEPDTPLVRGIQMGLLGSAEIFLIATVAIVMLAICSVCYDRLRVKQIREQLHTMNPRQRRSTIKGIELAVPLHDQEEDALERMVNQRLSRKSQRQSRSTVLFTDAILADDLGHNSAQDDDDSTQDEMEVEERTESFRAGEWRESAGEADASNAASKATDSLFVDDSVSL